MVHALEQSYRLLKPDGLLVDVHNLPVPAVIEVCTGAQVIKAGWLLDNTDFESERLAFDALIGEAASGIFDLEDVRDFEFDIYADEIDEFRGWLAEWWETAVLPERTINRLESLLMKGERPARISLNLPTRMCVLRSCGSTARK